MEFRRVVFRYRKGGDGPGAEQLLETQLRGFRHPRSARAGLPQAREITVLHLAAREQFVEHGGNHRDVHHLLVADPARQARGVGAVGDHERREGVGGTEGVDEEVDIEDTGRR